MVCSAISALLSRLNTYLTDRRTHRAARHKEARDCKVHEQRWAEVRDGGPSQQYSSTSMSHDDEKEDHVQPMHKKKRANPNETAPRSLQPRLQPSSITLELGRVRAAEVFYRM